MDNVDDIFKFFVSNKLKQLGLNGVDKAETTLAASLKKSALAPSDPVKNLIQKEPNAEETVVKEKKHKHKKDKKKKHKKEKKKHKEKENNCEDKNEKDEPKENHEKPKNNEETQSSTTVNIKTLKVDDEEVVIKNKTLNCYHETVSKIKEIEQLSLKVEPEDVEISETYANINNTNSDSIKSESNQTKQETIIQKESQETPPKTESVLVETETPENNADKGKPDVSEKVPNKIADTVKTEVEILSTLKELKSMSAETAAAVSDEKKVDKSGKSESSSTKSNKSSEKDSRHRRKHSSRKRSRSHSRKRSRKSRSRSSSHHKHHHHKRHRSRSRERPHRRHHRRRRSNSRSPVISRQDKVKLLAIAKANVMAQHKADSTITSLSNESTAVIRSGGVTVAQLTGICREIVDGKREVLAAPEVPQHKAHHPFQVKETPAISFNIKSHTVALSSKPITQLTKEFPVSCGSQHQKKEEVLEEVYGKWEPVAKKEKLEASDQDKVFEETPVVESNAVLIQNVIAQRINAVRQLQTDPGSHEAQKSMQLSQNKLDNWMKLQKLPGRFTGSTKLQPLSRSELERGHSAWANTHTFNSNSKVEGIGKCLLEKMGWRDGESLGKTNVGLLEPLKVSVKTDRKGLSSIMEMPAPAANVSRNRPVVRDLSGKHPVSALMEICTKRKWPAPEFRLVVDAGPDHSRNFLFKVIVNNTEYQPSIAAMNKKLAKAHAATAALQSMGLVPR